MLKALLPAIMKLFAYLLVPHLGIDSLLLPPRREYSVSRLEGTRECKLCASSVRIRSKNLLQIDSLQLKCEWVKGMENSMMVHSNSEFVLVLIRLVLGLGLG